MKKGLKYSEIPKRTFASPLIRFANFKDGGFVNLIRLFKTYANKDAYVLYVVSDKLQDCNAVFKKYEFAMANKEFEFVVKELSKTSTLTRQEILTHNLIGE